MAAGHQASHFLQKHYFCIVCIHYQSKTQWNPWWRTTPLLRPPVLLPLPSDFHVNEHLNNDHPIFYIYFCLIYKVVLEKVFHCTANFMWLLAIFTLPVRDNIASLYIFSGSAMSEGSDPVSQFLDFSIPCSNFLRYVIDKIDNECSDRGMHANEMVATFPDPANTLIK